MFTDLTVAPQSSSTMTVQTRVVDGPGEFTNRAYALGPHGTVISDIATATVRVRPEAVFDCGVVIGRAFDDENMNGYQNGPNGEQISVITDQTYDAEKFDTLEAILPPGSAPGRLATVDGTIITTDAYGRYSVPCAALPADIGSTLR